MKRFNHIEFHHLPRIQKKFADALATLASMTKMDQESQVKPIMIRYQKKPSYQEIQVMTVDSEGEKPWFQDIIEYLQTQTYPPDMSFRERRALRRLAHQFYLANGELYKRSYG